jgi:WD40 repeat protein
MTVPKGEYVGSLYRTAFSADGNRLAIGSGTGPIKVWNLVTDQVMILRGLGSSVDAVAFSPDGQHLAGMADWKLCVWDPRTGRRLYSVFASDRTDTSFTGGRVTFSPDGKWLISAMGNKAVTLRDAATGKAILTLEGNTAGVDYVAFSPDGKRLVTGGGPVRLWDVASGQEVLTLKYGGFPVFSPDGKRLAITSGGTITILDASKSMKEAGQ